jgi:hypothetical protein
MHHFDMEFLALHVLPNSWTLGFAELESPAGVKPPAGVSVVGDMVFSHPGLSEEQYGNRREIQGQARSSDQ